MATSRESIQQKLGKLNSNVDTLNGIVTRYTEILGKISTLVSASKDHMKVLEEISQRLDTPNGELANIIAKMQENIALINKYMPTNP